MNKWLELKIIFKDYISNIFIQSYLAIQTIARIALCIFAISRHQIHASDIPLVLANGLIADIISTFFAIPLIVLLQQCNIKYISKIFSIILSGIFASILVFSAVSQIGFWDEFNTNFNFIAVDYLVYTHEVIGTLKESLPLFAIIAGISIISILLSIWIYKRSRYAKTPNIKLAIACFVAALTIGQIYDSERFGQGNNKFAHELSKNGPYEFVYAYYNNSLDYTRFYPSITSNSALDFVRSKLKTDNATFLAEDSIERNITSNANVAHATGKPNIILITVESLSAEYLAHFGNKESITPYIDKLADGGMLFTNLYATGTRTVRGLEALTLGIPPLPGSSILRRPDNHDMFTIGVPLRENGYKTDFIYGGYSYFDNMKNYFEGNDFTIIDRSDIPKEKVSYSNVWGVADENLFDKVIEVADRHHDSKQAFFSLIMTTSNHRPYNFPEGRIDMKPGTRAAVVKYTDYAIGKFIEDAKQKPWFKDTIFVITADHCASSAGRVQLPMEKYKIPLIIYAPGLVKPSVNNTVASQIDIPPTILAMTSVNYRSKFFGQDIVKYPPNRAFISTYQLLGYIKNDKLVVLAPNADPVGYFLLNGEQKLAEPDAEMVNEAMSYYQAAYELLMNGKMKE